ncbi:hdhd3 [Symbiodinium necroappetens]|uniref:Hdhd3 protein n=1 Tax=Symbiodinium necroappetens TaxID=1628268 RepID=A0A812TSE5_9DINO|nr:hdhd3 [Symbiodinium necroappetens]
MKHEVTARAFCSMCPAFSRTCRAAARSLVILILTSMQEFPGTGSAQVPRLISLDSTGTLMRVRRPIGDLYANALHRVRPDVQVSAAEMTRVFPAIFSRQSSLSPSFGAGGCGCREWWRAVVEGTMGGAGIAVSDLGESFEAVFDDLYGHVFCGQEAWELLPRTVRSLESLREWCAANDCRLGVMSNMDDRLSVILQNLGILDKFDFVLTSYEARAEKPSAIIFTKALEVAGLAPTSHALHCGDSYKRDLIGATSVNWMAVLVDEAVDKAERLDMIKDVSGDHVLNMPSPGAWRVPHIGHIEGLLSG